MRMTLAQIAEAQKLAREWMKKEKTKGDYLEENGTLYAKELFQVADNRAFI